MTFGKNRVQHNEERIWSQFRFKDFDFVFYQDGRKITINAAKYATTALKEISDKLGISHKTVENQLTDALKFIRSKIEKENQ